MATHSHDIQLPRGLLLGAVLLIGTVLLAVAALRVSGVDISTRSQAATVAERHLRFEDAPDGSIRVLDVGSGTPVVVQTIAAGEGGFLRGALRALVRSRRSAGVGAEVPFHLVAHADGRLTLEDPATQQHLALESFGPTNAAVFAHLLAAPRPVALPGR